MIQCVIEWSRDRALRVVLCGESPEYRWTAYGTLVSVYTIYFIIYTNTAEILIRDRIAHGSTGSAEIRFSVFTG